MFIGPIVRSVTGYARRQALKGGSRTIRNGRGPAGSRVRSMNRNRMSSAEATGVMANLTDEENRAWMSVVANYNAPREAMDWALEMAGNEGQRSIIQSMGIGVFSQAYSDVAHGGDAYWALEAGCSHPEAVEEILMEAAGLLQEAAYDANPSL